MGVVMNVPAYMAATVNDQDLAAGIGQCTSDHRSGQARADDEIIDSHYAALGLRYFSSMITGQQFLQTTL